MFYINGPNNVSQLKETMTMLSVFLRLNELFFALNSNFFVGISPPPELLPVLGPLEGYVTPTLDTALLCSSKVGSGLGRMLDWFLRSFVNCYI